MGDCARAARRTKGYDTYELDLPAVVSVTEGMNEGIWPAQRDVEATDTEGRIAVWTATDLVDEVHEYDKRFGQTGLADPGARRQGRGPRAARRDRRLSRGGR